MMKQVALGNVVQINPSSIGKSFPFDEIDYIDISSVGTGTLSGTSRVKLKDAPSRAKRLVAHGDTILATVRPNLRSFLFIKNPTPNTVASTGFAVLRAKDKIDQRYLYYSITSQSFTDYLSANVKGAAYPAVDTEAIARGTINLPALTTQQKIAYSLSVYDDLIENNNRRIKILEEMAQAIYKEWFVNFRFPGHKKVKMVKSKLGMIPEGWEVKKVLDVTTIHRGRSYKGSELVEEGGFPFLNLKCIERDGGFRYDGIKQYSGHYKESQTARTGDIVIAVTDMTQERRIVARAARIPHINAEFGVMSMDIVKTAPINDIPHEYLYGLFRFSTFPDEVKQHANGANVLHLNPDRITSFVFACASSKLQHQYADMARNIYKQCDVLHNKNENLRKTRDLLLPKLISGEIDVEKIDIKMIEGNSNV